MTDDAADRAETLPSEDPGPAATELRRSSVNLDSAPIRAAATRIDISAVDAAQASLEDRFSLDLRLGRGGMGTVQRALDRRLLRDVAVKIIHGHLDWGPHQARFAREAQITAQLQHPNIVPVYSFERSADGSAAIVMQLVDGETLSKYLAACRAAVEKGREVGSPYRLEDRLERLIKVCDAVQYAHDHGVIHRDLKPANIMLGTHGEVYVMDWGLAGVAGTSDDVVRASSVPSPPPRDSGDPFESGTRRTSVSGLTGALTRLGDVFGTPQYMSPEQARGDTPRVGPASDQFALGLLFFELLFLKPPRKPLPDGDPMAAALVGKTETPQHAYGLDVPSALHAVLRKVTALEPRDRYPSVGAFAEDLRSVLRGEAPSVTPETPLQRAWRRFNHNPVRAMRSVLALVALAAFAITGTLYLKLRAERQMVEERARVAEVSARVSARAQHIEDALAQVEALLTGWATAAEQALVFSPPSAPDAMEIGAMRRAGRAAGLRYSPRHAQDVSYAHPSYLVPPHGDPALASAQLGRLAHLTPYLKGWLGADAPADMRAAGPARDGIALLWIYLALESGLLVTYPGNVHYPEGFDPRERPWYRDAFDEARSRFRAPYRSLSGGEVQLPCVMPLHDGLGQVMGLAAVDLSLTDLRERLRLSGEPAWQATWLLDAEGRVLVSTALAPLTSPDAADGPDASSLDSRGVALEPFPVDAVTERVRADSAGGVLELGDTLYFIQHLHSLDWTLLVSFDRERVYGERVP